MNRARLTPLLGLVLAPFALSGCDACPEPGCRGSLTLVVSGVVGALASANAYEAIVCVSGTCNAATFTLPPSPPGACSASNGDGSLCCETTWPKVGNSDCHARGGDLVLVLPLPSRAGGSRTVDVTVIDSEGDQTLVSKRFELEPEDASCSVDCREIRHAL